MPSTVVTSTVVDEVALIRIDNPPVNALSLAVIEGVSAAVSEAEGNPAVRALVIVCAGRTFIAGADIKRLEQFAWGDDAAAPDVHDLLRRIEDCSKPAMIAMHGTALGAGLEVAMAGHYRVATPSAHMGQPEVNLGLIPGAEGTQRLPRLVGLEKAIEMCVSGKPVTAAEALTIGLIDWIVDGDLAEAAIALVRDSADRRGPHPKTRHRRAKLPPPESLDTLLARGRDTARKTRRNLEAPLAAVEAIEASATLQFDEGCRREREIFFRSARSEQCKALIHAFFAERGVSKVPGIATDMPVPPIAKVAIVGAGTMGGGIAMACVNAGIAVRLTDTDTAALDKGLATVRRNYEMSVTRGRLAPEAVEARVALIQPQVGYSGLDDVDLIVEAVFEDLDLKKQVVSTIDLVARPGCLIATNTSTLDIDVIAAATSRPQDVIGLHFFSPANVMRLVEIVRGSASSPHVIAAALSFAKRLGKVGVVVGNCAGFVGNRMMFPYKCEAQFLVEEGATPEEVDRALTDWGMAMGTFAVDDLAGLDVVSRARRELGRLQGAGARRPLVAEKLNEMGRFGQKTGAGWYLYGSDRKPKPDPEIQALIERMAADAGILRRRFGSEEILERTIYALVNEGARALEEGFALRAADIDVICINGYGFPAFRGGPLFYADRVGLQRIHDRVASFHREFGDRWKPAPLLERLAKGGSTFREFDAGREDTVATRAS